MLACLACLLETSTDVVSLQGCLQLHDCAVFAVGSLWCDTGVALAGRGGGGAARTGLAVAGFEVAAE